MPEPPGRQPAAVTVLAFDYGKRRIGVAVGQSVTGSASPVGVARNDERGPDLDAIGRWIREWQPDCLVVGRPLYPDGSPAELQPEIDAFAARLSEFGLIVTSVDERYSSIEAERLLGDARREGRRGRLKKDDIDAAAAVVIAERYLSGTDGA